MHVTPALAAFVAVLWLIAPVRAEDCPAKSMDLDDIVATLNATGSCDAAMKRFKACQFGSTADVQFGDIVEKKCESDFLSGLNASQSRVYRGRLAGCDDKYRNREGTMWRSAAAFCRAEVSQTYSHKTRK